MGIFGRDKKSGYSVEEMQNWYQDRYSSVAIQKNFLLLFSIFTSFALIICLMIVKKLQEGKASEPYLIEYDKGTGQMAIVESRSKKEFTAQQALKETLVIQYIYHREAPKLTTIEDDMNYVRVSSHIKIYPDYVSQAGNYLRELRKYGSSANYELKVKSLTYLAANRLQVRITKKLVNEQKIISDMDYNVTVSFGFVDMEMPIEDLRMNPLGFQVSYYRVQPVKTFKSTIIKEDDDNNKNDNEKQNADNKDNKENNEEKNNS